MMREYGYTMHNINESIDRVDFDPNHPMHHDLYHRCSPDPEPQGTERMLLQDDDNNDDLEVQRRSAC